MRRLSVSVTPRHLAAATFQFAVRFSATATPEAPEAAAAAAEEPKKIEDCPKTKRIADLEKLVREANAKAAEIKRDILYNAADTQNLRKLQEKEAAEAKSYAVKEFGKDMKEMAEKLSQACKEFSQLPPEVLEGNKVLTSIQTGTLMSERVVLKVMKKNGFDIKGFQEISQ